jgi:adenylate kinase
LIAEKFGIPHISTGAIFRANVAEGTDLGQEAQKYMSRGEYVPDSVTNAMVRNRLSQADTEPGFLLDGYPRTLPQVDELDAILAGLGKQLEVVVEITADAAEVTARLLDRAAKEGRPDDTEDVISRRLEVYAAETEPIVAVYSERGLVRQVDGLGSIEDVNARIAEAIAG